MFVCGSVTVIRQNCRNDELTTCGTVSERLYKTIWQLPLTSFCSFKTHLHTRFELDIKKLNEVENACEFLCRFCA